MNVSCPKCRAPISASDVNVATDIGACLACGEIFKVSAAVAGGSLARVDLSAPPPGAWFTRLPEGFEVGASTRSPLAFFLVPFMCVWSGGSLGGIYGSQLLHGHFDPVMSLFGIPFLLGSAIMGSVALLSIGGRWSLRVQGDEAETFVGIAGIGLRRRFSWGGVSSITEGPATYQGRGSTQPALFLEGATRTQFAMGVSEARRYFLLGALRGELRPSRLLGAGG